MSQTTITKPHLHNKSAELCHRLFSVQHVNGYYGFYAGPDPWNNIVTTSFNTELILQLLQQRLPNLLAVYLFGSQASGHATRSSDVDLAVLVPGYMDPIELWDISSDLAEALQLDVDLLDFRAASTVMQYQILHSGTRLLATDPDISSYEAGLLSDMTDLNEARHGLIHDIQQQGTVYGK